MKIRMMKEGRVDIDAGSYTVYPPGRVYDVPLEDARRFAVAGLGVLEEPDPEQAGDGTAPPKPPKPTGKALTQAIVAAIGDLNPEEGFTRSGAPSVDALEAALGYAVSAAERDAAWAEWQKANPPAPSDPPGSGEGGTGDGTGSSLV